MSRREMILDRMAELAIAMKDLATTMNEDCFEFGFEWCTQSIEMLIMAEEFKRWILKQR